MGSVIKNMLGVNAGKLSNLDATNHVIKTVAKGESIDVIYVEGVIGGEASGFGAVGYDHNWTLQTIDQLINSDQNKAIMLYVNSPGGGVYESDELYLKLKEYKEKTGRPVYAYMAQTAASGGYYICMAADKVFANRMTMTGSIGVIMSLLDTSELEGKLGIKTENIVSGKNKAMGNPLTQEQREILQSMIDETYGIFVDIVAENRELSREKVVELADGRVYSAYQAKEQALIDEVATYEAALESLKKDNDLYGCEVNDQVRELTFFETLFGTMSQKLSKASEFAAVRDYLENNNNGKLMYYYRP
ncbi:signal peptide peptidase SppA [Sporanaerobium hydrogeniformans]|uniref:Signal peptide peptidase SppA n=2 Tax=Sporanaerobium hydrogeniformans TaxID=3072179 RepID=A0AC61DE08_9FIRM|nr:signal peptide peptidase SppA [Sporanaerobium hydrogeniformans]